MMEQMITYYFVEKALTIYNQISNYAGFWLFSNNLALSIWTRKRPKP